MNTAFRLMLLSLLFIGTASLVRAQTPEQSPEVTHNTWTTGAAMPTARMGAAAAAVGKNIYVIGGYFVNDITGVNEIYNIKENTWTTGAPDPASRAFMEPRFGYDFSRVRVHSDSQAAKSAGAVNAQAYTVGSDIVFGANHQKLGNQSHQRLLAHELAHVIQQRGKTGGVPRAISAIGEQEAGSASEAVVAGHHVRVGSMPAVGLQRETQTYDQAKQSVLDELHRSQPAAILPSRVPRACRIGRHERHDRGPSRTWRSHLQVRHGRNSSRTQTFDAAGNETIAFR